MKLPIGYLYYYKNNHDYSLITLLIATVFCSVSNTFYHSFSSALDSDSVGV